jgi:hypothetical protein
LAKSYIDRGLSGLSWAIHRAIYMRYYTRRGQLPNVHVLRAESEGRDVTKEARYAIQFIPLTTWAIKGQVGADEVTLTYYNEDSGRVGKVSLDLVGRYNNTLKDDIPFGDIRASDFP